MEKEEFKKKFPKLAKEMEVEDRKVELQFEVERPNPQRKFTSYDPDVIDFIRRCTNETQAYEIIEYMKSREEIAVEDAERLYKQLEEEGIRSFGKKKGPGYYEQVG
jgi:hypothetical protein